MNDKQKRVLFGTVAIVIGMLIYPPFHLVQANGVELNMGYGWIFDPPSRGYVTATVDVSMLLVQWIAVLVVSALVFLTLASDTATSFKAPHYPHL